MPMLVSKNDLDYSSKEPLYRQLADALEQDRKSTRLNSSHWS